jgi:hypothetical protein
MSDVIMRHTSSYNRPVLHILQANVVQVTDHTAVQERVEIGILKLLPSQIYRVEIVSRKIMRLGFSFCHCQMAATTDI